MVDYQNSKIYKIQSLTDDNSLIYIGSTVHQICQRLAGHKNDYKQWLSKEKNKVASFDIFDKYGIDNVKIELVEAFPCENKKQLREREGYFIRTILCVNYNIPCQSKQEGAKKYYQSHKQELKMYRDTHLEEQKTYRQKNKVSIALQKHEYNSRPETKAESKIYYDEHKEELKANSIIYRELNKEKINEQRKRKYVCNVCQISIQHRNKAIHERTAKHLTAVEIVDINKMD